MDATKGNIYAILNGNKQFLIPVYQRYYSWGIAQCQRLWTDIVDMQKKNKFCRIDCKYCRTGNADRCTKIYDYRWTTENYYVDVVTNCSS